MTGVAETALLAADNPYWYLPLLSKKGSADITAEPFLLKSCAQNVTYKA